MFKKNSNLSLAFDSKLYLKKTKKNITYLINHKRKVILTSFNQNTQVWNYFKITIGVCTTFKKEKNIWAGQNSFYNRKIQQSKFERQTKYA